VRAELRNPFDHFLKKLQSLKNNSLIGLEECGDRNISSNQFTQHNQCLFLNLIKYDKCSGQIKEQKKGVSTVETPFF
jgi:hypothetical protein